MGMDVCRPSLAPLKVETRPWMGSFTIEEKEALAGPLLLHHGTFFPFFRFFSTARAANGAYKSGTDCLYATAATFRAA